MPRESCARHPDPPHTPCGVQQSIAAMFGGKSEGNKGEKGKAALPAPPATHAPIRIRFGTGDADADAEGRSVTVV